MAGVQVQVNVTLPGSVDANALGNAIANTIRSLTGQRCDVVSNVRDMGVNRMDAWIRDQSRQQQDVGQRVMK